MEERRDDAQWVAARLRDDDVRFVVRAADGVGEVVGPLERAERPVLLGADAGGRVAFALDATHGRNAEALSRVGRLRDERGAALRHDTPSLLLQGIGLARWHARTRHCPRCGAELDVELAGHRLRCPDDGSEHFPRLEPAVIVAVVAAGDHFDDGQERILLGRQGAWPEPLMSTLAGFVEVGETIEQCCVREVAEESGVRVGQVTYVASQPWPFPASLMIGLRATALSTDLVLVDEIVAARWLSHDELDAAMDVGEVLVPPPVSIAHRLIAAWHGRPLRDWTQV